MKMKRRVVAISCYPTFDFRLFDFSTAKRLLFSLIAPTATSGLTLSSRPIRGIILANRNLGFWNARMIALGIGDLE